MRSLRLLLAGAVLGAVLSGCGSSHLASVLNAGLRPGAAKVLYRPSDEQMASTARAAYGSWRGELRRRVRLSPQPRYVNLRQQVFRRRLSALARRYGFGVERFAYIRVRQGQFAPRVIVRTRNYLRLVRAIPAIEDRLDPSWRRGGQRTHVRFEGFYFQGNDERGVPFVGAYDMLRGQHSGGGQFARSEPLYPYAHL